MFALNLWGLGELGELRQPHLDPGSTCSQSYRKASCSTLGLFHPISTLGLSQFPLSHLGDSLGLI